MKRVMPPSVQPLRAVLAAALAAVLVLSALAHGSWAHVRSEHHGLGTVALYHAPVQDQNHGHEHDEDDPAGVDQAADPQGSQPGHDGAHHHADANAFWPPVVTAPETSGEPVCSKVESMARWALYPPERPPCLRLVS